MKPNIARAFDPRVRAGGWTRGLFLVTSVALITACRGSVPSMIERMPPVPPPDPGSATGPDWAPQEPARRGGDSLEVENANGENGSRILGPDARPQRVVVRADLEDSTRFRAGVPVDAFVPDEPFNYVVTFRVLEVLEGAWPGDTIHAVIRSPFEQFAFPFSDVREFRLELARSPSPQYHLVEWDPTGAELKDRARQQRETEETPPGPRDHSRVDSRNLW